MLKLHPEQQLDDADMHRPFFGPAATGSRDQHAEQAPDYGSRSHSLRLQHNGDNHVPRALSRDANSWDIGRQGVGRPLLAAVQNNRRG